MKKIALAAASASFLFALSACGDTTQEPAAEDTTVVEETPIATDTATDVATDAATDVATDAATDAAATGAATDAPAQ
ncbi:MAG: hypothetical protein J0I69_06365 [Altererythrobacter sp.]|nr:hypothetical protein [Altererythrobacter sp.]OJU59707.1 MAG: hypothetical protein BGO08_01750 [Altererythrobacter sp. 66-12]